jgi:hypothetical protein
MDSDSDFLLVLDKNDDDPEEIPPDFARKVTKLICLQGYRDLSFGSKFDWDSLQTFVLCDQFICDTMHAIKDIPILRSIFPLRMKNLVTLRLYLPGLDALAFGMNNDDGKQFWNSIHSGAPNIERLIIGFNNTESAYATTRCSAFWSILVQVVTKFKFLRCFAVDVYRRELFAGDIFDKLFSPGSSLTMVGTYENKKNDDEDNDKSPHNTIGNSRDRILDKLEKTYQSAQFWAIWCILRRAHKGNPFLAMSIINLLQPILNLSDVHKGDAECLLPIYPIDVIRCRPLLFPSLSSKIKAMATFINKQYSKKKGKKRK